MKTFFIKKIPAMNTLDVVLSLIIVFSVLGGVGVLFATGTSNSKLIEAQSNLIVLRSQIVQAFSGSTDYSELTNDVAIKAGSVPQIFVKGNKIINQWGGDITLSPTDDDSGFNITFTRLPKDECAKLGVFQPDAWLGIEINNTSITTGSIVDISNACNSNNNSLTFITR